MTDKKSPAVGSDALSLSANEYLPENLEAEDRRQLQIAALLLQIDRETEQSRIKVASLIERIRVLTHPVKGVDAKGAERIRQLRDANEHLVLATLGAKDLQAKAEDTNRRQKEFLSMLAHELRNPLAPIAVAAEMLGKRLSADPQLMKFQSIICRQVSHMTRLVDDLMDASRMSSGKIVLRQHTLLLSDVIESAVETSKPFINKRRHHLSIDIPVLPILLEGDLVRLAQVFSNLLINAAKFSPADGKISIAACRVGDYVDVSIRDNGAGIEPSLLPVIFDLFIQGDRSLERSEGGLGIGLSLVRTLTEMHGGTVAVHSAGVGLGSEFIVRLPVSSLPKDSAIGPPLLNIVPLSRRILVIEDNIDASETLCDFLATQGHVTTSAFSGPAGLALAVDNVYDVIICDIGLPGIDGYEVVRQLRLHPRHPVPICIAVSGYNQVEHRTRATTAGFDHYLVKPIPTDQLNTLLALVRTG
jgi:signal transduction histidine kinase